MTVDTRTGEITERPQVPLQVITPADVRASVRRAKASLEKAAEEIVWQIEREAWVTLGYSSWTAMREAEYGEAAFMVPSKQRPELVERMRRSGLTQQEIAETAGVSLPTVKRDLNGSSDSLSDVSITNARGQQRPATYTRTESTPDATTGPAPASTDPESVTSICPTCNGTGKVTR